MSNEIVSINNNFPNQLELQSVGLIAKTAHISGLYGGIGGEAKIMMILLAAKELGVGPCQALNGGIWAIQGRVEISARLMNGLIRRAGHSIKVIRSDDECCTLKGTRTDGDSFEVSFTKQDAEKAGLWGSNTWKKYPGDMLYNRCMSRLGRRLFSDVIGQCYIEGEIREAKEVERLEQIPCEEITQNKTEECVKIQHNPETLKTFTIDAPHKKTEEFISFEQLTEIMKGMAKMPEDVKENYKKYMKTTWNVTEYEYLPSSAFEPTMKAIERVLKTRENNATN